jgi:hypothetical protein
MAGDLYLDRVWEVSTPTAVCTFRGVPLAVSNLGRRALLLREDIVETLTLKGFTSGGVAQKEALTLSFPQSIASSNERLLVEPSSGLIQELDFGGRTVRTVAGMSVVAPDADRFFSATRFDVSASGQVVIADMSAGKIFVVDEGGRSRCVVSAKAGGGFTEYSDAPLAVEMTGPLDAKWRADGAIVFSVGGERPCVKAFKDGVVRNVLGNGRMSSKDLATGTATAVSLAFPMALYFESDGKLLVLDADADRLVRLDPEGTATQQKFDFKVSGFTSLKAGRNEKLLAVDRPGRAIVEIGNGVRQAVASFDELPYVGASEYVRSAVWSGGGTLFAATDVAVYRKKPSAERFDVLAGPGGLVLNGVSQDDSVLNIRDLAFGPQGDLYILEDSQVKRIPAAEL